MKANSTKGFERLDNVMSIVKAITTITIHKKGKQICEKVSIPWG